MNLPAVKLVLTATVVIGGLAALYPIGSFIDANRVRLSEDYVDADLTLEGKRLKGFALGSEGLLADWYWMRSLQYIGDKLAKADISTINIEDLTSLRPRLLYPLLDNATELDPKFIPAYTYGAMVLPAIDKEQAIALTEKAVANNPDNWRMYQYLGYLYWRLQEYEKAAEAYERGSRIDGAPQFMKMMTAAMRTEGGSRETARAMYQQMYDEAQDQQTRNNAEFRLMEFDTLDELEAVNEKLAAFKQRTGRCPSTIIEIADQLRSVKGKAGSGLRVNAANELVDPSGTPYLFERTECRMQVNPQRHK